MACRAPGTKRSSYMSGRLLDLERQEFRGKAEQTGVDFMACVDSVTCADIKACADFGGSTASACRMVCAECGMRRPDGIPRRPLL